MVVAVAAVLVVAGGLRAMQVRQQREADDARTRARGHGRHRTVGSRRGLRVTPTGSAAPTVERHGRRHGPLAGGATTSTRGDWRPVARPLRRVTTEAHGPTECRPLPRARPRDLARAARDVPGAFDLSQANHALVRGEHHARAQPGASGRRGEPGRRRRVAHSRRGLQLSGDSAGAREAYSNCLTRAHTANISECRLLAASP